MPVRFPPEARPLQGKRSKKDSRSQSRIVAYTEPGVSFRRRLVRRLISPPVIIPVLILATVVIGFLVYYWTVFSGRIDNLLKGEGFTRSAGIYAVPKHLCVAQVLTPEH